MAYDFNKLSKFIDDHQTQFITLLEEAVAIKSVSATPQLRPEVIRIMQWFAKKLGNCCFLTFPAFYIFIAY